VTAVIERSKERKGSVMATPVSRAVLEMEVELLAGFDAELRARIVELEEDAAVYREVLVAALDALSTLTVKYDALRERYREACDRARRQREEWLIADAEDA